MTIISLKKRTGGSRRIVVPNGREKRALRLLLPDIEAAMLQHCDSTVVHGFAPGRSPVSNAMAHAGRAFTLTADLSGFFDSCRMEQVRDVLDAETCGQVFHQGCPAQGLPTSPAVANLAARGLDAALLELLAGCGICYTRYADDLTFSGDCREDLLALRDLLPSLCLSQGFTLHPRKTHLQCAHAGRRVVTGVALDADGTLHATRDSRRRLRAALHQGQSPQAQGLAEWHKMKPPHMGTTPYSAPHLRTLQRRLMWQLIAA